VDLQKKQSAEAVEGKQDLTAQVLDWARDRTEALEGDGPTSEAKPSQETKPSKEAEPSQEAEPSKEAKPSEEPKPETKVSPKVIVVALHESTDSSGEAHLFEDLQAAGRFIEALLESGLDQKRLIVFNCTQLNVQLTYRAVVHLKASEGQEEPDA
jgi:hypothetical protein